MTESTPVTQPVGVPEQHDQAAPGALHDAAGAQLPAHPYTPAPWPPPRLVSGTQHPTGKTLLLILVTFGIYLFVWTFRVHDQMKKHSGDGLGGGLALTLTLTLGSLVPFVPFITSSEVGRLYERAGLPRPVSGATGLWYAPGFLLGIGPLVWFVKTNNALNRYWEMQQPRA